jgi:hypothetical protein
MQMASKPGVAIRIGLDGKAEVKSGFEEIGKTGSAEAERISKAYERTGKELDDLLAKRALQSKQIVALMNVGRGAEPGSGIRIGADQDAQMRAYTAYQAQQQRQAEALRNVIDPLRVAQAAYDREIAVANGLLRANIITEEEHARAVALASSALEQQRITHGGTVTATNASRAATQNLGFQVQDFAVQVVGGTSVLRAFAMQFPQAAGALTGFEGRLGVVGAFLNGPWGIALTLGTTLVAGFADTLLDSGHAADEMAARQKSLGDFIDRTTGQIKEQNVALILNRKLQTEGDKATAASELMTARRRVESLIIGTNGAVMDAYRDVMSGKRGSLSVLTGEIENLRQQGPHAAQYVEPLAQAVANLVEKGRGLSSVNAQLRIMAGNARPGDTRKAFGEFGADTSGMARQIELQTDLATATTDLERARTRLKMVQEESDAATRAGGKVLDDWRQKLIDAKNAVNAAEAAQRSSRAATRDHARDLRQAEREADRFAKTIAGVSKLLATNNAAGFKSFGSEMEERSKAFERLLANDNEARFAPASAMVGMLAGQERSLELSRLELATVGLSAEQRALTLALFTKQQELQQAGADLSSDQAQAILNSVVEQDRLNRALEQAQNSMSEVRDFATSFVDTLASGRDVTKELYSEFIKLAAINPLKNLLNGNSALPTVGSLIGSVGSLFGGGRVAADTNLFFGDIGSNAGGTAHWRGGLTWVAENGPELINLPRGSSVMPASQTRQALHGANDPARVVVAIETNDEMFSARVVAISDQRVAAATPAIANGAANLAYSRDVRRASRRMGGY